MNRFFIAGLCLLFGCVTHPAPMPSAALSPLTASAAPTATKSAPPTRTESPAKIHTATMPPSATAPLPKSTTPASPATQAAFPSTDPVLVGAGDIAMCNGKGDEATAALLETMDGIVFTLGDNVYPDGTAEQFQDCYAPSWGKLQARTYPVPGNHDYITRGAKPYFDYFGARAGEPGKGYYSFDAGDWHVIALNSEIETDENSAQVQWLRDDLAQHAAKCTLALFHRPLFSSGPHGRDGSGEKTRALWDVLYENNADVILNGHDHDYERFAPQDPQGARDEARGIREFVVGTGGAVFYPISETKPNSEAHRSGAWGVLKLTLHASSYDWEFVPVVHFLFQDRGHGECH